MDKYYMAIDKVTWETWDGFETIPAMAYDNDESLTLGDYRELRNYARKRAADVWLATVPGICADIDTMLQKWEAA